MQSDVDRLADEASALKKDNRALTSATGKLQARVDAATATMSQFKGTHAALVAEKTARIADLLDAVADLKAAAKRRAPKKKPKD